LVDMIQYSTWGYLGSQMDLMLQGDATKFIPYFIKY